MRPQPGPDPIPPIRVDYGALADQYGLLTLASSSETRSSETRSDQPVVALIHGGFWRERFRLEGH